MNKCANRDVDKSHRSGGSETAIASFGGAGILHVSGIVHRIGPLDAVVGRSRLKQIIKTFNLV